MLTKTIAEQVLHEALKTGGDFAEIFCEDRRSGALGLVSGHVENATTNRKHGAGIRIYRGLNSVYVHTNDTTPVMGGCGLCLFRDGDTAYHYGANAGFLTFWRFSLKEDLCVAGMVNNSDRRTFKAMQEIEKQLLGRL